MTAFLCGALMVLPATGTGVLADWPAGAIYPVTVSLGVFHRFTGSGSVMSASQHGEISSLVGESMVLFDSAAKLYIFLFRPAMFIYQMVYLSFSGQTTVHYLMSFDEMLTEVHSANEGSSRPEMVSAQKRRGPKDCGEGRGSA